jgi:phage terminase large subunit-like protein
MKKGLFFFLLAISLFGKDILITNENVVNIEVSNKSENIFIFKEPITDSVFTKRQDGLIVKRNSINAEKEFLVKFSVGSVYEMSQDGKERVLVGTKYSEEPADIFFYGKETKTKYILRLTPKNEIPDLVFNFLVNQKVLDDISKEKIYEVEKKDNYRDLIIENQKAIFKRDKESTIEKYYKKQEINKIALDDENQIVTHLSRYNGATFIQDVYEIKSKIDGLNVGSQNLYKYITLPPSKEEKRAISILLDTVLKKGETTILSIVKDYSNDEY